MCHRLKAGSLQRSILQIRVSDKDDGKQWRVIENEASKVISKPCAVKTWSKYQIYF